jgi:hypothetical protein
MVQTTTKEKLIKFLNTALKMNQLSLYQNIRNAILFIEYDRATRRNCLTHSPGLIRFSHFAAHVTCLAVGIQDFRKADLRLIPHDLVRIRK